MKKPEVMRGVVALRSSGLTFTKIADAMNLSPSRIRQVWQNYLYQERRKCRGCHPELLEIDMAGMTVTMRWVCEEPSANRD